MMSNWEEVERLTNVAADATGTATEKMEIYTDSLEAKTKQLKATWEELIMSLNQSDSYKAFLDFLTLILNNLPTVISLITSLLIIFKGDIIGKALKKIIVDFGGLRTLFSGLKNDLNVLKLGWERNADGILTVASYS